MFAYAGLPQTLKDLKDAPPDRQVPVVEADDKPEKDVNIAGRQMPLGNRKFIS